MLNRLKPPVRPGSGLIAGAIVAIALLSGYSVPGESDPDSLRYGLLIPGSTTMVTAWSIPRNPLTDSTLVGSPRGDQIRWGYRLFMYTREEAPQFTRNALSCGNCHLNGGQRELAMPVVGVSAVFPEYNNRSGGMITLEDRIVGCFNRSENAAGASSAEKPAAGQAAAGIGVPRRDSREVEAIAAYITWLSEGVTRTDTIPWRGHNVIRSETRIPVAQLNPTRCKSLFAEKCVSCHGNDGQGVQIGDKKAGPLWGPESWNDGAGAARVYTLAGMIRYSMPYLNPGSLTDEEAQQIAAFINSMPRPEFPHKDQDYCVEPLPPDAVYYNNRR